MKRIQNEHEISKGFHQSVGISAYLRDQLSDEDGSFGVHGNFADPHGGLAVGQRHVNYHLILQQNRTLRL